MILTDFADEMKKQDRGKYTCWKNYEASWYTSPYWVSSLAPTPIQKPLELIFVLVLQTS